MCLAVPVKIVEIEGTRGVVDFAGNRRSASLMLVPEAKVGNYVLLHAGFAITLLAEADALESLQLLGLAPPGAREAGAVSPQGSGEGSIAERTDGSTHEASGASC